jgi:hypothetical protein
MRIRVKERCHFAGKIYEAGDEVILPEGMKGPHRAVRKSMDRIDYSTDPAIDANRAIGDMVDVPLYDVVPDAPVGHTPEQKKEADAAAERSKTPEPQPIVPSEVEPKPSYPPGEVRNLTHIEEREQR